MAKLLFIGIGNKEADHKMLVLGIESSCDDSAAAIVEDGQRVVAEHISTQAQLHADYGGVVPELAARAHLLHIAQLVQEVLHDANLQRTQLDAIAVTQGPGLIGSLMIGASFAKGLAIATNKPLLPVNHVHAHLFGALLGVDTKKAQLLPCLALIVSGGHTNLYYMRSLLDFQLLAYSLDDACGEAFDKIAKVLGLGWPGGPHIEQAATRGQAGHFNMPQVMRGASNFSYAGLKTHVVNLWRKAGGNLNTQQTANLCYAFQEEALRQLVDGLAFHLPADTKSIIVAGGVAANQRLRTLLTAKFTQQRLLFPTPHFCTDNAAMIAALGFHRWQAGATGNDVSWAVFSNYFQTQAVLK